MWDSGIYFDDNIDLALKKFNKGSQIYNRHLKDLNDIRGHNPTGATEKIYKNHETKIALKSGLYFMVFNKNEVPFNKELNKTNIKVNFERKYYLYTAPSWDIDHKIDALMDSKNIGVGYAIDDYIIEQDIKI